MTASCKPLSAAPRLLAPSALTLALTFAPTLALPLALALAAASAHAASPSITDPLGDFMPTFAGSSLSADLDVVDASVLYNASSNTFTISSTQAGAVGSTSTGFYVWGVDRGNGTAGFASIGITGVFFDTVVILRPNGTGTAAGAALPAGSVTVAGNTISATFSAGLLTSTGYTPNKYLWNLWPRDGAFSGTAAISDFAPNNASFTASVVPEPASVVLMLGGVGALLLLRRRQARSAD